jgi:hypothetical protein
MTGSRMGTRWVDSLLNAYLRALPDNVCFDAIGGGDMANRSIDRPAKTAESVRLGIRRVVGQYRALTGHASRAKWASSPREETPSLGYAL